MIVSRKFSKEIIENIATTRKKKALKSMVKASEQFVNHLSANPTK